MLEIVYSLTNCMNDNHLRNILLYEAFNEATEEFEKKPYIYFKICDDILQAVYL